MDAWYGGVFYVAGGYSFKLGEQWAIPLKLRTEYIFGDNMFVVGINGGVSYSF
jgi:hypothetical protein